MTAPSSPFGCARPEGLPSELRVHRYLAGELPAAEAEEVRQALERSSEGRALLEEHRSAWAALAAEEQTSMLKAIVQGTTPPRSSRLGWLLPVLAAAALGLFTTSSGLVEQGLRAKGGPRLVVYRERGGRAALTEPGDQLKEGDRLRFGVDLPAGGYVLVFGREARGAIFGGFPADKATPSPYLRAGLHDPLPGAVELDGSQGRESLVLAVCGAPLRLDELLLGGDAVLSERRCVTTSVHYDKVAR